MALLVRRSALALAAVLIAASAAGAAAAGTSDAAVKAAFVFNFAKFTEWPALAPGAPIVACVAGDDDIAAELVQIVKGETVGGHAVTVRQPHDSAFWGECQLLFVGSGERKAFAMLATALKGQPILTVSDGKDFSRSGGIVELYVEQGRLRFAINLDTAERARLRLSSRLLGLAKVVHDDRVQ
jgi:hypothetical protein